MIESEILSHLMKDVAEDALEFLVEKDSATVVAFSVNCQAIKEARRSRLDGPFYHRLPNVAASFSTVKAANPDIRVLVQGVVCDEFCIGLFPLFV